MLSSLLGLYPPDTSTSTALQLWQPDLAPSPVSPEGLKPTQVEKSLVEGCLVKIITASVKQVRMSNRLRKSDRLCISLWVLLDSGSFVGSAAVHDTEHGEIWHSSDTSELFYFSRRYCEHWLTVQSTEWYSLSTSPKGPTFFSWTWASLVISCVPFQRGSCVPVCVCIPVLKMSSYWVLWTALPLLSRSILPVRK